MSKRKKRMKQALLAGAALFGATKLGLLGGKPSGSSGVVGKTPEFRKSFVKPKKINYITKKSSKIPFPRKKVDSIGNVTIDGVNKGIGNKKSLFINRDAKVGSGTGIYQGGTKIKELNPKAINVLSDGKIQSQGKTFENKAKYRKFMDEKRAAKRKTSMSKVSDGPSLFGFRFDKPLFKKGSMIKARGGGMARTKPTKLY